MSNPEDEKAEEAGYDTLSFAAAAEPLIKWLNNNANPHASVIVTIKSAELVTSELIHINSSFIKP